MREQRPLQTRIEETSARTMGTRRLADNKWNERRSLRDTLDSSNIPGLFVTEHWASIHLFLLSRGESSRLGRSEHGRTNFLLFHRPLERTYAASAYWNSSRARPSNLHTALPRLKSKRINPVRCWIRPPVSRRNCFWSSGIQQWEFEL